MEMGERLKARRLELGMTLEQVGDKAGLGKSTVRKYEAGEIQNMRRDKIVALASALRTTPDFLMGWNKKEDEWTTRLRKNVAEEIEGADRSDAEEAGINLDYLQDVASGVVPVSLAEACFIAGELGCTVDDLVNEKAAHDSIVTSGLSDLDIVLIGLLKQMTDDQKTFLLAQLKTFVNQKKEKEETPF